MSDIFRQAQSIQKDIQIGVAVQKMSHGKLRREPNVLSHLCTTGHAQNKVHVKLSVLGFQMHSCTYAP